MEGQITMDAVFTQTNVLFNNNENKSQWCCVYINKLFNNTKTFKYPVY